MKTVATTERAGSEGVVRAREMLRPIRTVSDVAKELGMNRHSVNKAERKALWKLFDGIAKLAEEDAEMRELLAEIGVRRAPSTTGREFAFEVRNRTAVAREVRAAIDGGRRREGNRVGRGEVG
jgi:transposase-like protein